MMSILVVRSGMQDTLQDRGRFGYARWGINPSGAMDQYAAQVANILVGNALTEAIVEMHFPAGEFRFEENTLISLSGADFSASIDSQTVPLWKPVIVRKGSVLSFRHKREGCRCYLAVQGGFAVEPWLGSVSTNLKIAAGGLGGLPLRKGDRLLLKGSKFLIQALAAMQVLPWRADVQTVYQHRNVIAFVEGKEWPWLTAESQQRILSQPFTTDPSSDRMGCYLLHEPLLLRYQEELLSSAVSFGTIQMLPQGKLVVLMADHQTTGGYPRIGYVVSAHLPRLSQLSANESLCLHKISIEDAEKTVLSLQRELRIMQRACLENLNRYYA
jgi:antagonist of KipI